jgi:SWI/SNF-related matrix-associated actin-dependent regulator of chromatin subfamily A member 5
LNFNLLSLSKRERKTNYSVDSYFKDTLRAGPSKTDKAPKVPRAPKQVAMWVNFSHMVLFTCILTYDPCSQDFQFFDPALTQLQERELAVHKVC